MEEVFDVFMYLQREELKIVDEGLPGGSEVKNLPASVGDTGSIPDQEISTCRRATKPVGLTTESVL